MKFFIVHFVGGNIFTQRSRALWKIVSCKYGTESKKCWISPLSPGRDRGIKIMKHSILDFHINELSCEARKFSGFFFCFSICSKAPFEAWRVNSVNFTKHQKIKKKKKTTSRAVRASLNFVKARRKHFSFA